MNPKTDIHIDGVRYPVKRLEAMDASALKYLKSRAEAEVTSYGVVTGGASRKSPEIKRVVEKLRAELHRRVDVIREILDKKKTTA
jgi:hypothetical protein